MADAEQPLKIEAAEYRDRQRRLAKRTAELGLAGALVVSRGGATYDRYGHVFYLTGHYQHYSYLPDSPGLFSARAHNAFILGATGHNALCVSAAEVDKETIEADRIVHGESFVETLADEFRRQNMARERIGIIGSDVLPSNQWQALVSALPHVRFEPADDMLFELRRVKSPAEMRLIRSAAATNRRAVSALIDGVQEGNSEARAMSEAARIIVEDGAAIYYTVISSGSHSWKWATSPLPGYSPRAFKDGDLVRFDIGIVKHGYMSDFGRSIVVGRATPEQRHLIDTLHRGLDAAIGYIRPGIAVPEVVAAGDRCLAEQGVAQSGAATGSMVASFPAHWGHGLGVGWERPWLTADEPLTIEAGMYLAVERSLTMPGVGTVAAEQNLLVHENGTEVLTCGTPDPWM